MLARSVGFMNIKCYRCSSNTATARYFLLRAGLCFFATLVKLDETAGTGLACAPTNDRTSLNTEWRVDGASDNSTIFGQALTYSPTRSLDTTWLTFRKYSESLLDNIRVHPVRKIKRAFINVCRARRKAIVRDIGKFFVFKISRRTRDPVRISRHVSGLPRGASPIRRPDGSTCRGVAQHGRPGVGIAMAILLAAS
ncbi:hypothetical protein DBV15_05764 [Temnothorax longispinosus]|uniref:Uncharacterized protein n=1 Tax=Temnothorax longispinosus TaxID=300112 RepID=A0A4S2KF56_9HYME|nr:hypothetical protein DBV15_05764 [Temnothorax longispinosus]